MPTAMEKRLGEMLIKDQIITRQDFEMAAQRQSETGVSIGRVLIDMGKASEWEVAATLGKQLNVPFITLAHYDIDPEVLESIPEELVHKYRIVPVDRTGDSLTIALADPSNIYLLDELRLLTHCQIIPVISFESDIKEAIEKYYPNAKGDRFEDALKDISDEQAETTHAEESSRTRLFRALKFCRTSISPKSGCRRTEDSKSAFRTRPSTSVSVPVRSKTARRS
jgi:type IV pilus assembly protein PilB